MKGIGDYTAAAIASFAYNLVYPVVDGNVMRLLSRIYGIKTPINSTIGKKEIFLLAYSLIDQKQPGEFNQAIMEFGALHCKPQNPDCKNCIFKTECKSYIKDIVHNIPVKLKNVKIRKRYFHYLLLTHGDQIYLNKRTSKDIWYNMYDFPAFDSNHFYSKNRLSEEFVNQFEIAHDQFQVHSVSDEYKHILTHQIIFAHFYEIKILDRDQFLKIQSLNRNQFICIQKETINQFPLPRLIDKYLIENSTK